MEYQLLATDYDGTLAHHGRVSPETIAALERFRHAGGKPVLITGRILSDLRSVFDRFDLFDRIVAENGATIYRPDKGVERPLTEPVPAPLVQELRARNIPFGTGRCIVATVEPHQDAVLAAIHELGLEYQVIFNKGAVMVLPSGVNKGSGLQHALDELGISGRKVVAVGDAENDHALLQKAGFAVAVANALPALRERADLVTRSPASEGVQELISAMLDDTLHSRRRAPARSQVPLES